MSSTASEACSRASRHAGGKDVFYTEDLFRKTAAGVPDGRVHIFPGYGHGRASMSTATTHLTLGFMLAGLPVQGGR